ncbi:MAG: hypothetical protein H6706_27575 [Myxococcales bacterium]|nr:hypothetical protein [Myxococcales bacterium]
MTTSLPPRLVVVHRETDLELLLQRHGTRGQAEFWLKSRGRDIAEVDARHAAFEAAWQTVLSGIPTSWRQARVKRQDFDRFLFEPGDTVIAVGQDGLVANVAKYLEDQIIVGINPAPTEYEGVLVRHAPRLGLMAAVAHATRRFQGKPQSGVEARTMVQADLDDGQRLVALNEIFVGHRTHQSAKYRIRLGELSERHSSSGMIIATGTGATGWARSVHRNRVTPVTLPAPTEPRLAFFVREAWPSVATGTDLTDGTLGPGEVLEITSEFNEDGVIFGDGIETDHLGFHWGMTARIGISPRTLHLG